MSNSSIIRKIVIGKDPKDAMAYYLGMRAGGGEVHAIIHDEEYLSAYGVNRYLVYIEVDGGVMLWKSVDNMPSIVEFDCRFD